MRAVQILTLKILLLFTLALVSGCGTTFRYNPRHDQAYPSIPNNLGVEIVHVQDLRAGSEKNPEWSRRVEVITARALADELNHAQVFRRVKIHFSNESMNRNFSHLIELRVNRFRYYSPTNVLDYGRNALNWLGLRGALIARSIPREYISEVEVEFIVRDARSGEAVFDNTYSDIRSLSANGYEGKARQIQQTSDALETVVKRFVSELVKLPLSQSPP